MANIIRVSTSKMKHDRESINADIESVVTHIGEFRDAMLELSACWEGPAWNAFQSEVAKTLEAMYEVYDFFSEYIYQNAEAEKEYQRCETDNRNRVGGIWI